MMRWLVVTCVASTLWIAARAQLDSSMRELTQILAPFFDLNELANTAQYMFNLAEQAFGPDAPVNTTMPPLDMRFPLADFDLGLLLQLYVKCGSPTSDALATWCTGLTTDGTWFSSSTDSGEQLRICPPGVRTHPCTGRVLGVPQEHVEYLWPWEGIRCDALTDPTTVTHVYLPDEGLSCRLEELDFSQMAWLQQLCVRF
ncbi:hypothetical protein PINS_up008504 [Pythium insidiosum]|nr:hypothetical protein PINS_up008504 [Pythium insidiosum]